MINPIASSRIARRISLSRLMATSFCDCNIRSSSRIAPAKDTVARHGSPRPLRQPHCAVFRAPSQPAFPFPRSFPSNQSLHPPRRAFRPWAFALRCAAWPAPPAKGRAPVRRSTVAAPAAPADDEPVELLVKAGLDNQRRFRRTRDRGRPVGRAPRTISARPPECADAESG